MRMRERTRTHTRAHTRDRVRERTSSSEGHEVMTECSVPGMDEPTCEGRKERVTPNSFVYDRNIGQCEEETGSFYLRDRAPKPRTREGRGRERRRKVRPVFRR